MTIKRFEGFNGQTYTFPTSPGDQTFDTNFRALVSKSVRLPGASGGIREYGTGRAPSPFGMINLSTYLVSSTRAGMQTLRDNLSAMLDWGTGRLVDTINGVDRWSICTVNKIDMAEERRAHTDLFQPVKITFETEEPFWLGAGNEILWNSGQLWGGAQVWDGAAGTSVTNSGTFTVTTSGKATTIARVIVYNDGGSNVYGPVVQRILNGAPVDEVRYEGLLSPGQWFEANPRRQKAAVHPAGTAVWDSFYYRHPDFMRLLPGANTIKVTLGGTAKVFVKYLDRWT